jgi:hypothetical protein
MQIPNIPFSVLIIAPFSAGQQVDGLAEPMPFDLTALDEAISNFAPSLYVPVPKDLCPRGGLTLTFNGIKDFKPDQIIKNNEYLSRIEEVGHFITQAVNQGTPSEMIARRIKSDWPDVPLEIDTHRTSLQSTKKKPNDKIDDILDMVAAPASGQPPVSAGSGKGKSQCEDLLSSILEQIFDNSDFRMCEASWRGAEFLVRQGKVKHSNDIQLRLVSARHDDLDGVIENLRNNLIANPPNLILIDFPFNNTPRSISLMEKVITLADYAMVPTACWISSNFFNLASWDRLQRVSYLKHYLEDPAYAKWRRLQGLPGAQWLAVGCNRFLNRFRYKRENRFGIAPLTERGSLWLSPIWALGALICQSISQFGWPSRFTDYMNVNLPDLALTDGENEIPAPTEMILSDDRLAEFIETGIIPLQSARGKDSAFIPRETTLGGSSFKYRLFVSQTLSFLWWCRDNMDHEIRTGDPARNLGAVFQQFWQRTGHPAPEDLDISVGTVREDERIPLTIRMTPPRSVLPGGEMLEMTFYW